MTLEEYTVELLSQSLDPRDRAVEYIEVAQELLVEARRELEEKDYRQAAGRLWGSAALAVEAYALKREGRRLVSHRELWEYKEKLIEELGEWVYDAWIAAGSMHTCFYEGWCSTGDVEKALKRVERLVELVRRVLEEPGYSSSGV